MGARELDPNILRARALYYRLWHYMVIFVQTQSVFNELKALVDHLKNYAFNDSTKEAWQAWHVFLQQGLESFRDEQNDVLFSPSYAFVPLSASYYLEGQDNGKKRLEAIEILKQSRLTITSHTLTCIVSEDDLSFLCLMMNAFLQEMLQGRALFALHQRLFEDFFHLFSDDFIARIRSHEKSVCYQNFAIILGAFIKHERLFFNLIAH